MITTICWWVCLDMRRIGTMKKLTQEEIYKALTQEDLYKLDLMVEKASKSLGLNFSTNEIKKLSEGGIVERTRL